MIPADRLAHLTRRFLGSLSPRPPRARDEAWAQRHLRAGELAVWHRLGNADRRHAVGVARRVDARLGPPAPRPVVAAALLHDCGKLAAGLGTFGRVGATTWAAVRGPHRVAAGEGRAARYLRHEAIGAVMLAQAGSDPLTVALVAGSSDAPGDLLAVLRAADDE